MNKRHGTLALMVVLALAGPRMVLRQTERDVEYRLKAAYVLNFLRFVEWPDSAFRDAHAPLILGVLGEDPFGPVLDETIESERVGGHPVVVQRFRTWDAFKPCQAVFVSSSEKSGFAAILGHVGGSPILTIGDTDGFGRQGGHINFYLEENKIRFEINVRSMKQANLRPSSKLLRLAKIIGDEG